MSVSAPQTDLPLDDAPVFEASVDKIMDAHRLFDVIDEQFIAQYSTFAHLSRNATSVFYAQMVTNDQRCHEGVLFSIAPRSDGVYGRGVFLARVQASTSPYSPDLDHGFALYEYGAEFSRGSYRTECDLIAVKDVREVRLWRVRIEDIAIKQIHEFSIDPDAAIPMAL